MEPVHPLYLESWLEVVHFTYFSTNPLDDRIVVIRLGFTERHGDEDGSFSAFQHLVEDLNKVRRTGVRDVMKVIFQDPPREGCYGWL